MPHCFIRLMIIFLNFANICQNDGLGKFNAGKYCKFGC